jgi:hypothetical protein
MKYPYHCLALLVLISSYPVFSQDFPEMEAQNEEKKVILYLDLFNSSETNAGDSKQLFESFEDKMNESFPARPIRFLAFDQSERKLKVDLQQILAEDESISHLYLVSHGKSDRTVAGNNQQSFERVSLGGGGIFDDSIDFYFPVDEQNSGLLDSLNRDARDLFTGIRGRFTEDAYIYLDSCHILKGDEKTARRKALAVREVLDQKNGTFYSHSTYGATLTPFFQRSEDQTTATMQNKVKTIHKEYLTYAAIEASCLGLNSVAKFKPLSQIKWPARIMVLPSLTYSAYFYLTNNQGYRCNLKDSKVSEMSYGSGVKFKKEFLKNSDKPSPLSSKGLGNSQMGSNEDPFSCTKL